MSTDALESSMFLKLDGSTTKMIEALQMHLALEYEFFDMSAFVVESAIFDMYARMMMCGALDVEYNRYVRGWKTQIM